MITKANSWRSRSSYAVLLLVISGLGAVAGRALAAPVDPPPAIGELRPAPDFFAIPARRYQAPDELARSVDAIGIVRVEAIETIKTSSMTSEFTGERSWGRGLVHASIIDAVAGDSAALESFAFDATFLPGTSDLAVSNSNPPLEVGVEYLVFIDDGLLVIPGGSYRLARGKVWSIGHWGDAESREYPNDLSGMSVGDAKQRVTTARAR